jgi:signal transduction histidine kinase/AraC-like DNA-binding protein/CheY-like chemotaxis protein
MLAEMKRELAFHDNIRFIYKQAGDNSSLQVKQVKDLLKANIDLLIISPNEAIPLTPIVEQVYNQGIPVIVVDRKISSPQYSAYIGANNYEVGKLAGEYTVRLLADKGTVTEVTGLPGSSPAMERHKGFTDALKDHPAIKIVNEISGDWLRSKAFSEISNNASAVLNTDLVFAHNDMMAIGTRDALEKATNNDSVKIIGIDALAGKDAGIEFVAQRKITASVLYPTGGEDAIRLAVKILQKEQYEKENILNTLIVDSNNVRLMKLQAEKISSQQNDIENQQSILEEQKRIYNDQKSFSNILTGALLLFIFLGGLVFYWWKKNKRIAHMLQQQNEEISFQKNQLSVMSDKAEEAHRAKLNFFTNISHELRTPLTLILGPLDEIIASSKLHFSIKSQLEMVKKNTIRLLRLVNQLMDFRKIEESKMKLKASENNITDFVSEIINAFTETATNKKIMLRLDSKDPQLKVWFDVNMIDKVLFNILSNAFKYTGDLGVITIYIYADDGNKNVIINIEDSGIGMSPETKEHAFDLFYQGNDGSYKGTGLGLALSKELINLHHGDIKIKSEKWKGTSFEITIPLGKQHLQETELEKGKDSYSLNYEDAKVYINELEEIKLQEEDGKNIGEKDHSILIIEDNDEIRQFLKIQLSKTYEIIEAENGTVGLSLAYEVVPDVIISDIMLPGKDGMLITDTLKNDVRTSHIPIVILSAKGSMENQIAGLKLKADAYIVKPFNMQYLEETVKGLLRNREALKGHYTSGLPNEYIKNAGSKKIDRKFVSEFSAIIESNISNEDFGVNDICRELGISRVQLYRKVKALIGYNVNDYILNVKMQKAKYLLLNEDLSISEISYKVGFASQAYFSTVFKSKFGVTPKAFKENRT